MLRVILQCGLGSAEDLVLFPNSATERWHMASPCLSFPLSKPGVVIGLGVLKALYDSNGLLLRSFMAEPGGLLVQVSWSGPWAAKLRASVRKL